MPIIQVAIMHPYPLMLRALTDILNKTDKINVVHVCLNYEQLLSSIAIRQVELIISDIDVLIMDDNLSNIVQKLRSLESDAKVVLYTDRAQRDVITILKNSGISALLSKRDFPEEIMIALQHIKISNDLYLSGKVKAAEVETVTFEETYGLSTRETEIIKLIVSGYTLVEIAALKNRSLSTISTHKYNAMRKLGLHTNTELIKFAYEKNLFS